MLGKKGTSHTRPMGKKLANFGAFVGSKLLKTGVSEATAAVSTLVPGPNPQITDTGNNHDVQNEPIKGVDMPRKSRSGIEK
jgi:hypothetical protein